MSLDIGQLRTTAPAPTTPASTPAPEREASKPASAHALIVDTVELGVSLLPPPEALAEVAAAARRAQDLADRNRELHFHRDEESGRIIVQVRDLDGHVIRTIPPSEALEVMAGLADVESRGG
jgi:flagellar protein FlaG